MVHMHPRHPSSDLLPQTHVPDTDQTAANTQSSTPQQHSQDHVDAVPSAAGGLGKGHGDHGLSGEGLLAVI